MTPDLRRCLVELQDIDQDLPFLVLLTVRGLKPVSRYEKRLSDPLLLLMRAAGLCVAVTERLTDAGQVIEQIVFSAHPAWIEIYLRAFQRTPLALSEAQGRMEGYLFGFPPCCIEAYIRTPYAPNAFPREDQELLFHWACPGCQITSYLLPLYREVQNTFTH